jgi:exopolysaccharide production protein ExoZ
MAHTELYWYMATNDPRAAGFPVNGMLGVDIFFIISGFVVTYSTMRRSGAIETARTFLARRVIRIVPAYWFMSGVAVAILAWHRSQGEPIGTYPSPISYYILASFAFLFMPLHGQISQPVLAVGWTLNIEMYFYLLFAFGFWLKASISRFLVSSILIITLLIVIASHAAATGSGATILLEFIAGVLLARYVILGGTVSTRLALPLGIASALIILLVPMKMSFLTWRGFTAGPLAFFLVLAAISVENLNGWRWPRWLLWLGTISYSLYLVHIPLASILTPVLVHLHIVRLGHPTRLSHLVFLFTENLGSCALAAALHHLVEKPTHAFARRRFSTKQAEPSSDKIPISGKASIYSRIAAMRCAAL